MSIKISKKHGLNPSLVCCFFCGEEKEIALFGKIDKLDSVAPSRVVLGYDPCDKCKEKFKEGILVIECIEEVFDNRPLIQQGLYPTGRWCVLREEAVCRMINNTSLLDDILERKTMLVDKETMSLFRGGSDE